MVARGLLMALFGTLCGCAQAVAPAHVQDVNRERADLEASARARDGIPQAENLAQSGDLAGARLRLRAALEAAPSGSEAEWDVREALLKLAPVEPPEEEARHLAQRGDARSVDGADAELFLLAEGDLKDAATLAPGWDEPYFKLGLLLERTRPAEALRAFKLYLLASPDGDHAEQARTAIEDLERRTHSRERAAELTGLWLGPGADSQVIIRAADTHGDAWRVTATGARLHLEPVDPATGPWIHATLSGSTLEGQVWLPSRTVWSHDGLPCPISHPKAPVTGSLSDDGRLMRLEWEEPQYRAQEKNDACVITTVSKMTRKIDLQRTKTGTVVDYRKPWVVRGPLLTAATVLCGLAGAGGILGGLFPFPVYVPGFLFDRGFLAVELAGQGFAALAIVLSRFIPSRDEGRTTPLSEYAP